MKKIFVLTSSLPKNRALFKGNFVYDLAFYLSKKCSSVTIISPHIFGSPFFERAGLVNIIRFPYFIPYSLQKLTDGNGIADNIKTNKLSIFLIPFFVTFEFIFSMIFFLRHRFDCIHSHWIIPQGFIGALLSAIFKKQHISTIHAADVFYLRKFFFHKYILKFVIKYTTHFFIVSTYVQSTVIEMLFEDDVEVFKQKSCILPMGIECEKFASKTTIGDLKERTINSDSFFLLYIGRLSDKKGIEYLIIAMEKITQFSKKVQLIICGDGPIRINLEKKVKNLKLSNNIHFLGFIDEAQKIELLTKADIVIVPSIILDNGETEGMPVVILEAMAAGRAIIASNVSGVSDVIQSEVNGILVQQKKPSQISNQVIRLIKDPILKNRLGKEAYKSSKNYDWNIIATEYYNKLTELTK